MNDSMTRLILAKNAARARSAARPIEEKLEVLEKLRLRKREILESQLARQYSLVVKSGEPGSSM